MSQTSDLGSTLPKLPGFGFSDKLPQQNSRSKAQGLKYINGMPVVVSFPTEPEGSSPSATSATSAGSRSVGATASSPLHAAGSSSGRFRSDKPLPPAPFAVDVPHDKQVLRFYCALHETVAESSVETSRVRRIVLFFFLADQTVLLSESKTDNAGLPQGTFLKRTKVPGLTVEQLNVGNEVKVFSHVFQIYDCDAFTRKYLTAFGIEVPEPESEPQSAYEVTRALKDPSKNHGGQKEEDRELKRFFEFSLTGRSSVPSSKEKAGMQRYLEHDRNVLRYYAVWDDRTSLYGDYRYFTIYVFRADGTIEVTEQQQPNAGRDPVSVFISKQRIPRQFNGLDSITKSEDVNACMGERDFAIGATVTLFARDFYVYDCDARTREFLKTTMGCSDAEVAPRQVGVPPKPKPVVEPPPYNGFGLEEDSLNNWRYLVLKPPKKDFAKLMKHERDKLRFEAKMIKCAPEDANRRFILTYHVADDTVSLYEQMDRNNGLLGGKFLERSRMPGIDPSQLAVGKEVCVNSFHFRLTATDEATLKYMEARPKEFSIADANKILKKLREMILAKHVRLRDAFRSIDTDHSGSITFEEFRVLCRSLNMELIDQEIITLMRYFDRDHDGLIGYADFCDVVLPSNDYASGKAEILDAASLEAMTEAQKMEMEHKQKAMQMAAFKTFRARFEQRRLFYMDAFRIATDASPDSRIGRDELLHVIRRTMKLDASLLKDSEFEALSGAFFSNGRDRIDLADFFKIIDGTDTWQLVNEGGKKH